jgi:hypothetical protein
LAEKSIFVIENKATTFQALEFIAAFAESTQAALAAVKNIAALAEHKVFHPTVRAAHFITDITHDCSLAVVAVKFVAFGTETSRLA